MGLVYWEQQKYEEARNAFQKALDAGAEKTGTLYNLLASCEMQIGDYQSALDHYNLGLQLEGNSAELTQEMEFNQIAAYEKLYDWESAKAKVEEYIAKYPDDEAAKKRSRISADKIEKQRQWRLLPAFYFSIKFFWHKRVDKDAVFPVVFFQKFSVFPDQLDLPGIGIRIGS